MGGAPSVPQTKPPDAGQEFSSALSAYTRGAPALYQEEAQYQPLYNQLQQQMTLSNIGAYMQGAPQLEQTAGALQGQAMGSMLENMQTLGPQAAQAAVAATPYGSQIAQFSQGQLGAGFDPTLQGLYGQVQGAIPGQVAGFGQLGGQLGAGMSPINAGLGALAQQAGTDPSGAQGFLTGLRNQAAANTRTPMFQQTAGQVMGQLGTTDPLLAQMQGMAQQGLALGSSLSPEQIANATQQARAAYSARGLVQSNPAVAAEILNRDQYGQQLLASRQAFGQNVQQLGQAENQQQIANAMNLQGVDIGQTQFNQQMAGNLGMQIPGLQQAQIAQQAGLYGQLGQNVMAQNQQQMALQQAANAAQMGGYGQAAGLQQTMLGQQMAQQQLGLGGLQYLGGIGQQGMANVLGQQSQAFGGLMGAAINQPFQGPQLFNSSGMLQLEAQNQMAGYNQMNQANAMNAQSKGAASGAMMSAGGAIGGALITGVAAVAL